MVSNRMAKVIFESSQDGCREDSLGTAAVKRQDLETPITLIQRFSLFGPNANALPYKWDYCTTRRTRSTRHFDCSLGIPVVTRKSNGRRTPLANGQFLACNQSRIAGQKERRSRATRLSLGNRLPTHISKTVLSTVHVEPLAWARTFGEGSQCQGSQAPKP